MIKTWGPHNRRPELPRFRPKPRPVPPPWAGGIVINHAEQAELEARRAAMNPPPQAPPPSLAPSSPPPTATSPNQPPATPLPTRPPKPDAGESSEEVGDSAAPEDPPSNNANPARRVQIRQPSAKKRLALPSRNSPTRRKRKPRDSRGGNAEPPEVIQTLLRHRAQCRICRHPECEAIERDFVEWVPARDLVRTYRLGDRRTVYRHAAAIGLYDYRRKNRQRLLDYFLEQAPLVKASPLAIVAAIRLSATLDREAEVKTLREETAARGDATDPDEPPFILSLEGLPRTDAVTGVPPEPGSTRGLPWLVDGPPELCRK